MRDGKITRDEGKGWLWMLFNESVRIALTAFLLANKLRSILTMLGNYWCGGCHSDGFCWYGSSTWQGADFDCKSWQQHADRFSGIGVICRGDEDGSWDRIQGKLNDADAIKAKVKNIDYVSRRRSVALIKSSMAVRIGVHCAGSNLWNIWRFVRLPVKMPEPLFRPMILLHVIVWLLLARQWQPIFWTANRSVKIYGLNNSPYKVIGFCKADSLLWARIRMMLLLFR